MEDGRRIEEEGGGKGSSKELPEDKKPKKCLFFSWPRQLYRVVDIFIKGGAPNLEAKLAEVQKGHYMGQLVVPPPRGSWKISWPHLICPKAKQVKKEGEYPGRRSRGRWRSSGVLGSFRGENMEDPAQFFK